MGIHCVQNGTYTRDGICKSMVMGDRLFRMVLSMRISRSNNVPLIGHGLLSNHSSLPTVIKFNNSWPFSSKPKEDCKRGFFVWSTAFVSVLNCSNASKQQTHWNKPNAQLINAQELNQTVKVALFKFDFSITFSGPQYAAKFPVERVSKTHLPRLAT